MQPFKSLQLPPSRTEAEIQEEEELQLALALSQSEAEAKEVWLTWITFQSLYNFEIIYSGLNNVKYYLE